MNDVAAARSSSSSNTIRAVIYLLGPLDSIPCQVFLRLCVIQQNSPVICKSVVLLFPDELPGGSETVEGDGNWRIRLGGHEPAARGQRNGGSQGGGGVDIPILQRRQSLVSL